MKTIWNWLKSKFSSGSTLEESVSLDSMRGGKRKPPISKVIGYITGKVEIR